MILGGNRGRVAQVALIRELGNPVYVQDKQ